MLLQHTCGISVSMVWVQCVSGKLLHISGVNVRCSVSVVCCYNTSLVSVCQWYVVTHLWCQCVSGVVTHLWCQCVNGMLLHISGVSVSMVCCYTSLVSVVCCYTSLVSVCQWCVTHLWCQCVSGVLLHISVVSVSVVCCYTSLVSVVLLHISGVSVSVVCCYTSLVSVCQWYVVTTHLWCQCVSGVVTHLWCQCVSGVWHEDKPDLGPSVTRWSSWVQGNAPHLWRSPSPTMLCAVPAVTPTMSMRSRSVMSSTLTAFVAWLWGVCLKSRRLWFDFCFPNRSFSWHHWHCASRRRLALSLLGRMWTVMN